MTRGEVADFLEKCRWWFEPFTSEKEQWNEALDMAIEALQQVTGKLNNRDDSLLTADAEAVKERKSKLDLISRQDAIEAFADMREGYPVVHGDMLSDADVVAILHDLPLVRSELIRCKDCKYYIPMNRETKTGICNLTMHQNFGDNWFCAGAERRTDG